MLEYSQTSIQKVSVHQVGNKTNGEQLRLSKSMLNASDDKLHGLLKKFFLHSFVTPEFYNFTSTNENHELNPLFTYASQAFDSPKLFHATSINIAKHLFELSIHPQIKSGDLFVAYFKNINAVDEMTDAIGIFKSENRQEFLKVDAASDEFGLHYEDGINIEKLDKGCLIFNTDRDKGYNICIIDKSNKGGEAQYWKDSFLQITPCSDDYHYTKEFLTITKNFVTNQLSEEFEVSKADKIDLLNRSVEYFKSHETFDKDDFEKEVFQDKNMIKSFQNFDEIYREEHEIELDDNFDISAQAVKKQARVFKSVLKLDKNFHIYIHGERQMVEKGYDEAKQMNYYKLFFKEES